MNEAGDALEGVLDGAPELVALMVIRAPVPQRCEPGAIGNYQVHMPTPPSDSPDPPRSSFCAGDGSWAFTISLGGCS